MRTVSWLVLALVAFLILLGSVSSLLFAYFGDPADDVITGTVSLQSLGQGPEVVQALRGRRGTAAAFGLAFAVLMLIVVVVPYRRGEVWAWWALLICNAFLAAGLILRIPTLHITQGATTSVISLLAVVALLLDVARLSGPTADTTAPMTEWEGQPPAEP
jgi:hypothetical protein